MLEKYINDFLLLDVSKYLKNAPSIKINLFIIAIALGLCIAALIVSYHKIHTLRAIKQLLRHNAKSEEEAKTLKELRLNDSRALKRMLSQGGQLTDVVKMVGKKQYTYEEYTALQKSKELKEEKIDFSVAKFYIAPDKADKAKRMQETENPSYIKTALACVLIIAVAVCITLLMPEALSFLSKAGKS